MAGLSRLSVCWSCCCDPAAIRIAEPGEFTKRAFLNGRIDLTQAEAVIDLIRSKSDRCILHSHEASRGCTVEKGEGATASR